MREYQDNKQMLHRHHVRQGVVVAVLLLLAFFGVVWLLRTLEENNNPHQTIDPTTRVTTHRGGALYNLRDDVETILIIGLDKYEESIANSSDGYRNDQQADFLLLLLVNRTDKTCQMLHINRDTMANVPVLGVTGDVAGTLYEQLALAHTYGTGNQDSCRNTVHAVSSFLHETPIEHYLSITMDAVEILNDAVGGVTVKIEDDFSGVDKSLVKGETITLKGSQALTFVRARSGMEEQTNLNRMARQRQYMSALQLKLTEKIRSDDSFSLQTAWDLSKYMQSDCSVNHLAEVANCIAEFGFSEIQTIEGEAVEGEEFMEFYADDLALQSQILDLFYVPAPSQSQGTTGQKTKQ